jgi:hypothetical protein
VTAEPRIALLEHDSGGWAERLALELAAPTAPHIIRPRRVPDLPLRLRKIGDAPGRVPGAFVALLRGDYQLAHAFTAQDAAVAVVWSRLTGRPVVFTQREPLARENVSDRRLRLATLRVALEHSDAVVAPDDAVAESLRRWMAAELRVLAPDAAAEHLELYRELCRR